MQGGTSTSGGADWTISYTGGDGTDVTLTVVPEPASALLLLGGIGLIACRRRVGR